MKYKCGHNGCDVCGGRECAGIILKRFGQIIACEYCIPKALKLAIHVAESFTTFIDLNKPCGKVYNG